MRTSAALSIAVLAFILGHYVGVSRSYLLGSLQAGQGSRLLPIDGNKQSDNNYCNPAALSDEQKYEIYASLVEANFGARVSMPDQQLISFLRQKQGRSPRVPTRLEVLQALYQKSRSEDLYQGFQFPHGRSSRFPIKGYQSNFYRDYQNVFDLLESLMLEGNTNPSSIQFIAEAGSFVGSSASRWAEFARKHKALVLCIDTWEGDVNMWVLPGFREPMSIEFGRSHLFDNFLQNVIDAGITDAVVPMAASSVVGAKVLWAHGFLVDVAYVDSAHEQGETLAELFIYWELLRPGGVLLGDDYDYFPAVKHDVDLFVKYQNVTLHFTRSRKTFAIQKPAEVEVTV